MCLYDFLKHKRMTKALTQREAAELIGKKNHQFISNIERGAARPSVVVLKQLCDIYGVHDEEMLEAYINDEKEKAVFVALYKWSATEKKENFFEPELLSKREIWVTAL